ncbi:MAG: tripartite tricarboxylate transporter substrate binding protein BugD [Reyranella sp.]|uniref:Bug family tripartite tricarboxylate transporter substrate binding protein n=1 Tax=Reyranella sp. TaxID=1929291 RepID=UPI0025EE6DE9|nr:tripartite tricarboxylate transporter substrate-binding protein [Reyranella sp.]MBR2819479.1 tripartite tricarboxylate transporter substrate binding protein BugD [Reyranella sp.]
MLRRTAFAVLAALAASPALAQPYPSKPINLIVPFSAGGPTDVMARIVGERMSKELGQQIVIDNVTGAAGSIAMGKLVRSAPDGYTIGIGHLGTNVVNGAIYKNLNYDLIEDLVPIALLPSNPLLVVTSTQVPAKDLKELVAYLNANADKVSGGTAGMGSGSHIGALAFFEVTGTKYQLVPYRGTGPAVQDLIANQIQIMIDQSSNSLPHIRAGKLKVYAVAAKQRTAAAPDIPTTAEAGFPGIEVTIWHGLWAPKGTPREIIDKLNAAAVATLKDPEVRRKLEDLGQDIPTPAQMQPAAFGAFQRAEFAKWKAIIDKAGVKVE